MEITVNGVPTLAVPVDGCRYRCAISCNDATVEPRSRIPSPPTPPSTAHLIRFFLSSAALALGRIVIGMLTVFKKTNVNFQFWFAELCYGGDITIQQLYGAKATCDGSHAKDEPLSNWLSSSCCQPWGEGKQQQQQQHSLKCHDGNL
ncbi:Dynamin family [Musa troglodytarum]|uniref:Dynamin family n=1 Tax=Musa troglodytarum TaxID=320322 RepID=A0A9E7FTP5_9LILI|nr:Dynamin family [Musa troglodytarum]